MASTRSTRSRFSSPHQLPNGGNGAADTSKGSASEGSKKFLQNWLEPTPQSRPSFEDHGLVRTGVMEGMAPLGELPKTNVIKKKASEGKTPPIRRIILKQSSLKPTIKPSAQQPAKNGGEGDNQTSKVDEEGTGSRTSRASTGTPNLGTDLDAGFDKKAEGDVAKEAGTKSVPPTKDSSGDIFSRQPLSTLPQPQPRTSLPPAPSRDSSSATPSASLPTSPSPAAPTNLAAFNANAAAMAKPKSDAQGKSAKPARRALPSFDSDDETDHRARTGKNSRAAASRRSLPSASTKGRRASLHINTTAAATAPPSSSAMPETPATDASTDAGGLSKEAIAEIIGGAIEEALSHHRYPTAWALRTLWEERSNDANFVSILESVSQQRADSASVDWFFKLLESRKRDGRKDNKAYNYFVSPADDESRPTPPKAEAAPYREFIQLDLKEARRRLLKNKATAASNGNALPADADADVTMTDSNMEEPTPTAADEKSADSTITAAVSSASPPTVTTSTPTHNKRGIQETFTSGNNAISSKGDAMTAATAATPSSRKRRRRGSASSDSSALTELSGSPSLPSPTPASRRDAQTTNQHQAVASAPAKTKAAGGASEGKKAKSGNGKGPIRLKGKGAKAAKGAKGAAAAAATTPATPATAQPDKETTPSESRPIRRTRASVAPQKDQADTSKSNSPFDFDFADDFANNNNSTNTVNDAAAASFSSKGAAASKSSNNSQGTNMPAAVSTPLFPNLPAYDSPLGRGVRPTQRQGSNDSGTLTEEDAQLRQDKKREASSRTRNQTPKVESSLRHSAQPPIETEVDAADATPSSAPMAVASSSARTRRTRSAAANTNTRSSRSAKRTFDEVENLSSPTSASVPGDATPRASRAVTPSLGPATKKQRTSGLRVKSSPVKKKGGAAAGVPRPTAEGISSLSNAVPATSDDNDDYCSACGAVGDLLCCESCSRAFHFECVDLDRNDDSLPDQWFCNVCLSKEAIGKPETKVRGPFGALSLALMKINPQAFKLPAKIQTYFDGVKVGAEGDYEDISNIAPLVKPQRKKTGYEEAPDFYKVRDNEKVVLCHNCHKATASDRPIIPCSQCGLYWHIDCLDPPLAVPPVLRTWVCPAHADSLLSELPDNLAPAHKFRKIKDAPVIKPSFSRGMKNNGFIEIEDEPEEEESGWHDVNSFGRIYRLPATGIMLDFISQLRQQGAGRIAETVRERAAGLVSAAQDQNAAEALLSLRNFGDQNTAQTMSTGPSGLSSVTNGDVGKTSDYDALETADKESLQAMLAEAEAKAARIRQILAASADTEQSSKNSTLAANQAPSHKHTPTTADGLKSPSPEAHEIPGSQDTKAGDDTLQMKSEPMETDLPTPATTAADNAEPINGAIEKSSPVHESAMNLD